MGRVQADEEVDSLIEELEEIGAYADRPHAGNGTAEDSGRQVRPVSSLQGHRSRSHKSCTDHVLISHEGSHQGMCICERYC